MEIVANRRHTVRLENDPIFENISRNEFEKLKEDILRTFRNEKPTIPKFTVKLPFGMALDRVFLDKKGWHKISYKSINKQPVSLRSPKITANAEYRDVYVRKPTIEIKKPTVIIGEIPKVKDVLTIPEITKIKPIDDIDDIDVIENIPLVPILPRLPTLGTLPVANTIKGLPFMSPISPLSTMTLPPIDIPDIPQNNVIWLNIRSDSEGRLSKNCPITSFYKIVRSYSEKNKTSFGDTVFGGGLGYIHPNLFAKFVYNSLALHRIGNAGGSLKDDYTMDIGGGIKSKVTVYQSRSEKGYLFAHIKLQEPDGKGGYKPTQNALRNSMICNYMGWVDIPMRIRGVEAWIAQQDNPVSIWDWMGGLVNMTKMSQNIYNTLNNIWPGVPKITARVLWRLMLQTIKTGWDAQWRLAIQLGGTFDDVIKNINKGLDNVEKIINSDVVGTLKKPNYVPGRAGRWSSDVSMNALLELSVVGLNENVVGTIKKASYVPGKAGRWSNDLSINALLEASIVNINKDIIGSDIPNKETGLNEIIAKYNKINTTIIGEREARKVSTKDYKSGTATYYPEGTINYFIDKTNYDMRYNIIGDPTRPRQNTINSSILDFKSKINSSLKDTTSKINSQISDINKGIDTIRVDTNKSIGQVNASFLDTKNKINKAIDDTNKAVSDSVKFADELRVKTQASFGNMVNTVWDMLGLEQGVMFTPITLKNVRSDSFEVYSTGDMTLYYIAIGDTT